MMVHLAFLDRWDLLDPRANLVSMEPRGSKETLGLSECPENPGRNFTWGLQTWLPDLHSAAAEEGEEGGGHWIPPTLTLMFRASTPVS